MAGLDRRACYGIVAPSFTTRAPPAARWVDSSEEVLRQNPPSITSVIPVTSVVAGHVTERA